MTVAEGSVTALLGPDGAGKSTVLRACLGYGRQDEGTVLVFGLDPRRKPRETLPMIGYVPQHPGLYARLTVKDHLELARAARRHFDLEYAMDATARSGLGVDRSVGAMSGGERAKVSLILALATNAPLLLLDEPLASLDPLARREFLTILRAEVQSSGRTVVLSSHVVGDVAHACDRLVVLAGGRVVLDDAIAAIASQYWTHESSGVPSEAVVGVFADVSGQMVALTTKQTTGSLPATLEEIVLGHLASPGMTPRRPAQT